MAVKIVSVQCPTCESVIKFVKGDAPRRCICCTKEADVKAKAAKMALDGATVVEAGVLKIKPGANKGVI